MTGVLPGEPCNPQSDTRHSRAIDFLKHSTSSRSTALVYTFSQITCENLIMHAVSLPIVQNRAQLIHTTTSGRIQILLSRWSIDSGLYLVNLLLLTLELRASDLRGQLPVFWCYPSRRQSNTAVEASTASNRGSESTASGHVQPAYQRKSNSQPNKNHGSILIIAHL